ncbi:MAG: IS3 family transposase, partial [Anaerolineae bacterium]|nr:IS3 family transposase [Anaerolineae bacterium]
APELVDDMLRNQWTACSGIRGRYAPDFAALDVPTRKLLGQCPDGELFRTFQRSIFRQYPTPTCQQAQQIIDEYMDFYNYERIQLKTKQIPYQKRCLSK